MEGGVALEDLGEVLCKNGGNGSDEMSHASYLCFSKTCITLGNSRGLGFNIG
ncbi:hypothetical protein Tco_0612246, partial [Tanacetum coccineum]